MKNHNYRMTFTFTGSQNECIEQIEILKECLVGSIHSEIVNFKMQEAVITVIENIPNEKYTRTVTQQDNTCTNDSSGSGIKQFGESQPGLRRRTNERGKGRTSDLLQNNPG